MVDHKSISLLAYNISRRQLMITTGLGLSAITVGHTVGSARGNAHYPVNFMQVSEALTGKRHLNPQIGRRLYGLLAEQSGFAESLRQMHPLPKGPPDKWPPAQQKAAGQIISAWYLGKVGEGTDAQVVSYEKALMFDAVSDVLVIRSYCSNRPGYWAAKPDTKF